MRQNRLLRLLAVLLMIVTVPVRAQGPVITESVQIMYRYNLNSTTEIFCSLGQEVPVADRVQDATSTTMTAVAGTPFLNVAVGDMIRGTDQPASGGEGFINSVVARASSSSITINTALSGEVNPTLTSATLFYRTLTCGTGINSGAFSMSKYGRTTVQIDITQLVLAVPGTSTIDARILCRTAATAQWLQVYPVLVPPAVTATYVSLAVVGGWAKEIQGTYHSCRVGLKINAADDGGDTGTNAEQVTISLKGATAQ